MSNYTVSKRYKDSEEPYKSFEDLKDALLYCIDYDSLCQDNVLDMVVTNIAGEGIFQINQRGKYKISDRVNPYEMRVILDFVRGNLEDK